MISTTEKEKIVSKFKLNEKDTGSAEVQVALLSEEIEHLLNHLQKHKKDFHSKKGLLKMVAKRRKLLKYLEKTNEKKYKELIKKIGLKS
ncbi:MAG: 30S ribosomal protein S15 [Candidatus Pacebacteria bacterium]|nr:30S ribosomal protein S15 [Candidatus Paceibacterota bacterium]